MSDEQRFDRPTTPQPEATEPPVAGPLAVEPSVVRPPDAPPVVVPPAVEPPQAMPPVIEYVEGPLPVCEYTGDSDEPCEEPSRERRWSGAAVITAASIGAIVGGLLVAAAIAWTLGLIPGVRPLGSRQASSPSAPAAPVTISADDDVGISEAVATKVLPAVVNITIYDLFRDPLSGQARRREVGNGSGVMIREDGYILTNYHVIEGADEIVATAKVDELRATVVGTDPSSDLAVIKVEDGVYPVIDVGDSGTLRVGQYVMAVGSPFGLEKTATAGIVSALNRSSTAQSSFDITTYTNLIQTDAAINPGNSGGALADAEGRLVGINTLIQSPSGAVGVPQSAGIGFAIPVNFAMDIAEQLIENGKAVHPYLGVSTETLSESLALQFGLPVKSGALIRFVQPGSPAEEAGLLRGDIIIELGGREVGGVEDVFAAIREHKVGEAISVLIVRGETEREFEAVLGSDADRR